MDQFTTVPSGGGVMAIFNKDGELQEYTWKDVFINPETNKWEPPTRWLPIAYELVWSGEMEDRCPLWLSRLVQYIREYERWLKKPRGVTSTGYTYKPRYVIKYWYDVEDPTRIDGFYSEEGYDVYETEEAALAYLKKNIRCEGGFKPKLDTIEEYCKEFGFEFYERKY